MTRGNANTVHLGVQDWLVLAGILLVIVIPSIALWSRLSTQTAEILVRQEYILDRLDRLEGKP
jgi:hypothetical protein